MEIAILGFGTVGSGVYDIISNNKSLDIEVSHVFSRPGRFTTGIRLTENIDEIISDSKVDCIIETMGGLHPSYEYIVKALRHGKHVVTANKEVVAEHFLEFHFLAQKHGVKFRYEASVGGGIPWIHNLYQTLRSDTITSIQGIFNGTSNFILDKMTHEKLEFEEVLMIAQDLGYAERDPKNDIDGYDVQSKILISSNIAYQTTIKRDDILRLSMRNITKKDIEYFNSKDRMLKYIGESESYDGLFESSVMLHVLDSSDIKASVRNNNNIGVLHGEIVGELAFFGQGAGKYPTAHSIVQDILSIKENTYEVSYKFNNSLKVKSQKKSTYVIRSTKEIGTKYLLKKDKEYQFTREINLSMLRDLLMELDDDKAVVFKGVGACIC
ncbi:homoserine dehydrogenase [Erysipelothrix sp. HDW6A]|uniref:homoserine dehydrogenase n=1 Tax=Erysipelothrix sp. HDW6A TaxID=2714928 RepID=UPI00140B344C|nr:homoserine dehydrogenase [Erysipelothrix sp. HDW6A]QIK58073.1 homoserine dehydrogenase [Erysipelothrix sp. HDW6A]